MRIQIALASVPLSIARKYVKNWNKNGIGVKAVRQFMKPPKKGYRFYIPIKPKKSAKIVPPSNIVSTLDSLGYKIDDYVSGIAVDRTGNRRMRIGKLLKDDSLRQEFANDPQRSAHKDEYVCVLSSHPYDVIGMSTGRRWDMTSCMRLDQPGKTQGGVYKEKVAKDVAEGTIVAYAISPKDTNIANPHARLLIKPFYKTTGGNRTQNRKVVLFRVETKVYGTPIPGFMETVSAWLRKVNSKAEAGVYTIAPELYDDGVGQLAIHADFNKTPDDERFKYLNENREQIPLIVKSDIRWLGVAFQHMSQLYYNANNPGTQAANLLDLMNKVKTLGSTVKEIGQQVEKFLPDADLPWLAKMLPQDAMQPIADYSARLTKATDAEYAYDPESPLMSSSEILTKRAYWDARWLAKMDDLTDEYAAGNTFLSFIRSRLTDTPEFRKSKAPGSIKMREYLGMMFRIAAKSSNDEETGVKLSRKLAPRFKVDTYFNPTIEKLMGRIWEHRMKRATGRADGETASGLLCAVDRTWPAQNVELIADSGNVVLRQEVFEDLLKINTEYANWEIATRIREELAASNLTQTSWNMRYPWMLPFIKSVARGPYPPRLMQWAQDFIAHIEKVSKEMDDIFKELGLDEDGN
jgi:hypothetical protein